MRSVLMLSILMRCILMRCILMRSILIRSILMRSILMRSILIRSILIWRTKVRSPEHEAECLPSSDRVTRASLAASSQTAIMVKTK